MLKSLELSGFKSFADATKFEFSSGITAVVGPNGSGKSNVVDGIKWILGDQSPKSLRGKEMTDVIFNGTPNRKAGTLAEATLTFDNSSRFLPVDATEIQVGRRLWRSGDSEYLLNGAPVRLKDVRQLFMGTGAGSAAYSIIEQGRVDEILRANAISRRAIFEEAAGISLYKTRRAEFVRRMERVDQILVRLTDIVDEVESQRNALRSQAEKAAKYREISEELRHSWLGLAADDDRLHAARLAEIESRIAENQAEHQRLESDRAAIEQRLQHVDREMSDVDRRLREKDREVSALRESLAGSLSTIRLQSARRGELEADVLRLKRQTGRLEERAREGIHELAHLQSVLDDGERTFRKLRESVAVHDRTITELTASLQIEREQSRSAISQSQQLTREITGQKDGLLKLQSQQQAATTARTAAEQRRVDLVDRIIEQENTVAETQALLTESQAEFTAAKQKHDGITDRRQSLLTELSAFQSNLASLREQRSGSQARLTVLEDLENRQEGFGIGVKEILRRAQTSDYPPWNEIAGTVADLIDVDLEHAALLEAALGPRTQWIVIRRFAPLVDYLRAHSSQISGRVGFLECPPELSKTQNDLTGQSGIVSRAADLATAMSDDFANLPAHVLADTWLVETLDAAFALANGVGRGCRFITLQGELLEADGTLTVGTLRNETAVVSRKSELRQLKNELLRLDDKVEREENRLAEANDQLAAINDELAAASQILETITAKHNEYKATAASRQRELTRLQREHESLETEIIGLRDVEEKYREEIAALQSEQQAIEQQQADLQREIAAIAERIAAIEQQHLSAKQQRDEEQLLAAKQEERLQSSRDAQSRASREHQLHAQQREESQRRLLLAIEKRRDVDLSVLESRSRLAEVSLAEQQRIDESEAIVAEKDAIRARRAELARQESTLRQAAHKIQNVLRDVEMAARESQQRRAMLAERIAEEYQIELAEIVQSGASAFEEYLAERTRPSLVAENEEDESEFADIEPEIRFEDVRDELEAQVDRLRRRLKAIGSVNTDSLRDLDEIEERWEHLSTTLADLVEAKKHLEDLVRRIDQKCKQMFRETFDAIRGNFQELFRKAFGGGDGDVILEDPDDVLECGIDIVARPPGKELKSITLLSGGEKTLTAFALLLALFRHRPSPYCVLDEVDAALDEANVERLLALVLEFKTNTQFVIITHRKPTMTIADTLYGVTMEESGVSKRMTVKFENIGENGEFLADNGPRNAAA